MLAGSQTIGIQKGQHQGYEDDAPLANFWLRLGNQFGLKLDSFADSSGELVIS